jgi:broad specificity phosphatase PhoE
MFATVFLARHGETEWNQIGRWQGRTDIPLSDVGRTQARELAERLRRGDVGSIHTSDLARARETAEIVARALGLPPPHLDPDLRERGFGCFEGLTGDECAQRFPDAWARYLLDRRSTPPGAEPQDDVVARMERAMTAVAASVAAGGVALVVSHGGSLRSFIAAATGTRPPPIANGTLFRATVENGRYVSFSDG